MEQSAHEVAQKLYDVRKDMADLRRVEKSLSTDLKKRMKDGEDQDYFQFVPATKMEIEDLERALKWAKKHAPHLITVNTSDARVVFANDASIGGKMGTPEKNGFVLKTTETLRELKVDDVPSPNDIID